MLTAWRIVKKRHATGAFDGGGACLFGGRWNSPGVAVVYVASSRSLAILEMVVHLEPSAPLASYVIIPCAFAERLVTALDPRTLPPDWRRQPAPPETASIGDAWVREARSAVLRVPSAIVEEESNFLLNPEHPAFSTISIGEPQDFTFDERLVR